MSNKTPRISKYTSAGGRAFLASLGFMVATLAKIEDECWLRFSNMIMNCVAKPRYAAYTVSDRIYEQFTSLANLESIKNKIATMNSEGIDHNWIQNNLDLTNFLIALAKEQTDVDYSRRYNYSSSKKLVIGNTVDENSILRYINSNHILNQPDTAEVYDYE